MTKALVSAGSLITLFSFILAYGFHYNHFFEFLTLGILFMFIPTAPAELHSCGKTILLYILFLVGGLAMEFGGLHLMHTWHYNYNSLIEYILLFAWAYPAWGFILALSYMYARKILVGKEFLTTHVRQNPERIAKIICIPSLILAVLFFTNFHSRFSVIVGGYFLLLSFCAFLSIISERRSDSSYIRDFLQNWRATLIATLLATYVFMLAQELPNLAAQQWNYTWQTSSALDTLYLGLPLATWILWPFLVVGNMATLYAIRKSINS